MSCTHNESSKGSRWGGIAANAMITRPIRNMCQRTTHTCSNASHMIDNEKRQKSNASPSTEGMIKTARLQQKNTLENTQNVRN